MENAQPEPSMEEILASIRRIISEDEEDATPRDADAAAPVEALRGVSEAEGEQEAAAPEAAAPIEPAAEAAPSPAEEPLVRKEELEMITKNVSNETQKDAQEAILGPTSAAAASAAFESLSQTVQISSKGAGRTLEDIVVEILKPMIKEWLDDSLPAIVEEKVEEEVRRVARRRGQ